ncbi:hypothetical protein Aph01nite_21480 [Acrocarpospora phusangensis]|uniref:Uncharacterized protein n=1 Tax=Acrocarpospora phusangensis TaxID=1070424 RepID=A0A919UN01_9ACTN|nr:hypothetical protein [Acrocarpospora phusangensis]GIH23838.1 hypothetical protein Aph01nite_21480 [Acrocarpospora phusangensis]
MTDKVPGGGGALARRLRELRGGHWPDMAITQVQLRIALDVSAPLISSWESVKNPKIPPLDRIREYAAFFATRRSMAGSTPRKLALAELTGEERAEYERLLEELRKLRNTALGDQGFMSDGGTSTGNPLVGDLWYFADDVPIAMICSEVPLSVRAQIPYSDPNEPDHIDLYRFSDLDSLMELHGHLRAANPRSLVTLRTVEDLTSDDLTSHIVLLGGVDWNRITASFLNRLELPVRQVSDWNGAKGPYFEVDEDPQRRHYATLDPEDRTLREDVAFFYRGPNLNNVQCTISICNGMYARGVYGAVRALTDARFRDRNAGYLRERFAGSEAYSILSRVRVEANRVITPDWTIDTTRLHEWPERQHA